MARRQICRSSAGVWVRLFLLMLVLVGLNGCAGRLNRAADSYYSGKPHEALETLTKGADPGQRNRLLFLMEQGVIQHDLGEYRQSAETLLQAAALIEQYEMINLSEQAGSLVTTEWLTRYKGEYSERLWVHTYLMMDFLQMGEFDAALVEAKRALKILGKHPESLKQAYFTRALIALSFANVGEDNGAFLEYRKLAEDLDDPTPVAPDLVALAGHLGMPDEVEKYQPYIVHAPVSVSSELVLLVANGRIPEKLPGNVVLPPSIRFSFPFYREVKTPLYPLHLLPLGASVLPVLSTDLAAVARAALEERRLQIMSKETVRVVTKEAISQSVGNQHGDLAEIAVRLSLFLLEEPDLRYWQTLPGRLAMIRIPLAPGEHHLELAFAGNRPAHVGPRIDIPPFHINAGQRIFKSIRF